jgi:Acetyl-CoA dehydrogenase C-terminal like
VWWSLSSSGGAGSVPAPVSAEPVDGQLKEERLALGRALGEVQSMLGTLTGWLAEAQGDDPRALYKVGLSSRRFLLAVGDLIVGWLLQRQAEVALRALSAEVSAADKAFYTGKLAAARFFAREVLPRIGADRRIVEGADLELMELPEDAF